MTDSQAIESTTFTTSSAVYLRCLLGMWLKRYGLWLLLAAAIPTTVGIVYGDVRFFIITAMIIFLLAPMLIAFIFLNYLLTPAARQATLPKSVKHTPGGPLTITYHTDPPSTELIPASQIAGTTSWKSYRVLILKNHRPDFLLIPEK